MAEIVAVLANVATAFGIFIAIRVYVVERERDRRDLELDTYRTLSDKYFQYLHILIEHPQLSSTETAWIKDGDDSKDPRQDLLVQLAVNLIETAFFLYQGQESGFRQAQWSGWEHYLRDWCAHPAFVAKWPEIIDQYDERFRACVTHHYNEVHNNAAVPQAIPEGDGGSPQIR